MIPFTRCRDRVFDRIPRRVVIGNQAAIHMSDEQHMRINRTVTGATDRLVSGIVQPLMNPDDCHAGDLWQACQNASHRRAAVIIRPEGVGNKCCGHDLE